MATQPATEDLAAAFAGLRRSLRAYLRRRLPNPTVADDLLQDVFLKALSSKQIGRRIDNLGGWLYAATRTTLADYFRSSGMPMEALSDDIPNEETDDPRMHQELSLCLRPFIDKLPPLYRDTLIAAEFQGATMRALAEAEGVSVSAVKSRAARARAMLRRALLQCCNVEFENGLVSGYRRIDSTCCPGAR
ncbi:MAG TPA: sigma-70 family RNA polymerase sigma factor [Gammaproteobacteria bacterium]